MTDPIKAGDTCEVIDDPRGEMRWLGMVGHIVTVLSVFPEQLVLTDDMGWLCINCDVKGVDQEYWSHTDLLRKVQPPRDDLQKVEWSDLWRPMTEIA